ncbi:hypothetical protein PORCRE_1930 [Porphyromonas crevioricanis JCM 15906]|uniref:Uncharacterized protein n=1 Tax=Porphyromonas crevioricanis JCM 15906 TaxID=1305617 RepID=T1CJ07_9PORP|nr:T9SS type A sorting domain-containing protein [Porphyromonas crevioricanis]GAD06206.1 hypothetical protein PORCRE_1930 [Porphyromonas crevioricanis JCM 15906]SJZ95757.1 Por secretion system C-terminal sorting domain-containing protein [Porphyromonas crevioricanis]
MQHRETTLHRDTTGNRLAKPGSKADGLFYHLSSGRGEYSLITLIFNLLSLLSGIYSLLSYYADELAKLIVGRMPMFSPPSSITGGGFVVHNHYHKSSMLHILPSRWSSIAMHMVIGVSLPFFVEASPASFVSGYSNNAVPQSDSISYLREAKGNTTGVTYAHPAVLSNLGTNSMENRAVCNLLTKHKEINQGAHILASSDKPVIFIGSSTGTPTAWHWTAPGAKNSPQEGAKANFEYSTPGIYDYPTLEVTTAQGTESYKADLKLKVGGTSEVTTIDMRKWEDTYLLGTLHYEGGADVGGYVGGTNNMNIEGFGNLFMFGTDDAYMDGVNVYLHHKPTKFKEGAKILMRVWLSKVTSDDVTFTYLPIEAAFMKMEDIKADGEDGAWALTTEGAVASFKFETPLDLNGKPIIFISIEGFSNDPKTEDFCLLMDVKGKQLDDVQASNRLAHNSFGKLKGEEDYLRPISHYGGGFGSFAICPIVRIAETIDDGVEKVRPADSFDAHVQEGGALQVFSAQAGSLSIFDLRGAIVATQQIEAGQTLIDLLSLPMGIYLVKGPNGVGIKIIKQ